MRTYLIAMRALIVCGGLLGCRPPVGSEDARAIPRSKSAATHAPPISTATSRQSIGAPTPTPSAANPGNEQAQIESLVKAFLDLRKEPDHSSAHAWDDPADEWESKPVGPLDHWAGRNWEVVRILGKKLGDGTHSKAEVIALIGAPDEILTAKNPDFGWYYQEQNPDVTELLAFYLYGDRYMLFFASDQERVLSFVLWCPH